MISTERSPISKPYNYTTVLLVIAIPLIVYLYFLHWKTGTVYGDDLYIYKDHEAVNSFSDKISIPNSSSKFRPIHGLSIHYLIELFQKNVSAYYTFNIAIQVLNTFLFAFIVNLFLRSFSLSLLFGLAIGLSRFSYFNITQLLNGGALEGLALTFFLVALFFLVKPLISEDYSQSQKQRSLINSILFANLGMYTHERYIVLLVFILLLVLLYPGFYQFTRKQKIVLSFLSIGSVALNVFLKKVVYGMAFFMGTGGQKMKLSFSDELNFFTEAVLSIFQLNKGPEYLVGIKYTSLPFFDKILVVILLIGIITAFIFFLKKTKAAFAVKQNAEVNYFWLIIALITLLLLLIAPAILTIRLEQRWLQAPYAVLILIVVIMASSIQFKNTYERNWVFGGFLLLLLWVDFNYLNKGADNIYMTNSEKTVKKFGDAVNAKIIHPETQRLFIWEKKRDPNTESGLTWELSEGYFFDFYQNHRKQILFVDSIYRRNYPFSFSSFANFNDKTDQIIYLDNNITDITDDYLKDSLRQFTSAINNSSDGNTLFSRGQVITSSDIDKFTTTGFYENEDGIRWVSENATISFAPGNSIKDSLCITLKTYIPDVCKNVKPQIFINGPNQLRFEPISLKRENDVFTFVFYFKDLTEIQKLTILSEKIDTAIADKKDLSFPFVSIEIKPLHK